MFKKRLLAASREMTLPDERYRAVRQTAEFLQRLAGGDFPRVPKAVRQEAHHLLRHYPTSYDMRAAARSSPEVFQEKMEDLHKFVLRGTENAD